MGTQPRRDSNRDAKQRAPGGFQRALQDFSADDNVGSPYCVRRYVVDKHIGGAEGLAAARQALAKRDIRLLLDFVANHVAPDHPWVVEHPEYFIRGDRKDLEKEPASFFETGGNVFACGRIRTSRPGRMCFS